MIYDQRKASRHLINFCAIYVITIDPIYGLTRYGVDVCEKERNFERVMIDMTPFF
jgi:hypothetical protein